MSGERFYHCSFFFPGVPKMRDIEPAFADQGDDWIRLSAHSWIVWTPKQPIEIYKRVLPLLDVQDNFIVTEMNPYGTVGRLPEWAWKWINSKAPNAISILAGPRLPPPS